MPQNCPAEATSFRVKAVQPITRPTADKALREACDSPAETLRERLGYQGYSTHSLRRTWATTLDRKGTRQRVIQHLGGWTSLAALQRYLEVDEDEVEDAIASL